MIFLILGPAGSGKTTLCSQLEQTFNGIKIFTTRKARIDDKDNYFFVNHQEFLDLYTKKRIITKIQIFGEFYGLENRIERDNVYVAVGDIFTLQQLKNIQHESIYLDVPLSICRERLIKRGDDWDSIRKKIEIEYEWGEQEKKSCTYILHNLNKEGTLYETIKIINQVMKNLKRSQN